MPFTYTNRKGFTYYLCLGITKTGKSRYYFARQPKDTLVDAVPDGYQVEESVNGIVSLVKAHPQLISAGELVCVDTELKKHPQGQKYRAVIKKDQIVIYESQAPDLSLIFAQVGWMAPNNQAQEWMERRAQFSPIMRFILANSEKRVFAPQRWCFRGSIDDWIDVKSPGEISFLAKQLIPILGTDEFFELF